MVLKVFDSLKLSSLTKNIHSIKDLLKAADHICSITTKLFGKGYGYFLFDVTSLFTSVPLNKTINIILQRINKDRPAKTNKRKSKSALRGWIKNSCIKTSFLFKDKFTN